MARRIQSSSQAQQVSFLGKTYDLIEYRLIPNPDKDAKNKWLFKKQQAHITNQGKALCYGQRIKLKALPQYSSRFIQFKVVTNGSKQYSNSFK